MDQPLPHEKSTTDQLSHDDRKNLIAARERLCAVRDRFPAWFITSKKINDLIAEIEALMGY